MNNVQVNLNGKNISSKPETEINYQELNTLHVLIIIYIKYNKYNLTK